MLDKLTCHKHRCLDVEAGKAMPKGADVFMLSKVAYQLGILLLQLGWTPRVTPIQITFLAKAYPCCISNTQVFAHVIYVCHFNHLFTSLTIIKTIPRIKNSSIQS